MSRVVLRPTSWGEVGWWFIDVEGVQVGHIHLHSAVGAFLVEVGYWVNPAWRGKGIGTLALSLAVEKARADGRQKILARTVDNPASDKILAKCGFLPLEVARGSIYKCWERSLIRAEGAKP